MLRVGVVSYLNARPLVHGLYRDADLEMVEEPPSAVARSLVEGQVDIALVPVAVLLDHPEFTYIPGVSVGADGPVASVLLFEESDLTGREMIDVALDPHSRTSHKLTRIFYEQFRGISRDRINYAEMEPRAALAADPAPASVLAIGDLALHLDPVAGRQTVDLAESWVDATGLPFVFAVWALRPEVLEQHPDLTERFVTARDDGLARLESIAHRYAADHGIDQVGAVRYLSENIRFVMDERDEQGLTEFCARARRLED